MHSATGKIMVDVLPFCIRREALFRNRRFVLLLLIAPAVFSWKMSYSPSFDVGDDALSREYWNAVIYYPFKLSVIIAMLAVTWLLFNRDESFYGCSRKHFHLQPYLWLLVMMVPLVAAASTQDDFLFTYPKFQTVPFADENGKGFYQLLFELSYGSDFIGIELFFRGFLIVAFMKFAGKGAILPMALFYCTIHFGKPLGECISSFFGGIILGVVSYHTRSIWGGLMVHLGIAWLMELGGYLGNLYKN